MKCLRARFVGVIIAVLLVHVVNQRPPHLSAPGHERGGRHANDPRCHALQPHGRTESKFGEWAPWTLTIAIRSSHNYYSAANDEIAVEAVSRKRW